jgi:phosphonate transport system substrate-binding protein
MNIGSTTKTTFVLLAFFITFLYVTGVIATEQTSGIHLSFGVYQSDKATVMYRKFLPVLESLQEKMETSLGQAVDIELKIFKGYAEANDDLVDGKVDFVRFGPASYALAKERNEAIQLIAMEGKKGKKYFRGLIVVRTDSTIKILKDLKGKRFAFGNEKSTIGRYLAQAELVRAGLHADDLSGHQYLGRHDMVFKAVELGDFDAGALKESTFKRLNKKASLRIIKPFNNVTKPWIARAGLSTQIVKAIRQGLTAIDDKGILKVFKASGFLPTTDQEYTFVREGMLLAKEFEYQSTAK